MTSLFFSCSTTSKINGSDGIINRFEGVDNIKIGTSGVKEIKETYGNVKVEKYWESWGGGSIFPFFFIGSYKKKIEIKEVGLTFYLTKKRHRLQKRTVFSIVVDSTSRYKTSNGIGIGSSYQDIKKEFGETKYSKGSTLRGSITSLVYRTSNDYRIMNFINFGYVDSINFEVQEIVIE